MLQKNILAKRFVMTLLIASLTLISGCVGVAVVGAGAGAQSATDTRTLGTQIDDETLETRAMSRLRGVTDIWQQSHIEVVSFNRLLLVVGQTPNDSYRKQIGEVAAQDPQLRRVINEVQVAPPRSIWSGMGDAGITTKIKASMLGESDFPSGKIKVVTEDSVVYLFGIVPRTVANKAAELASQVSGVSKVVSLIEVE